MATRDLANNISTVRSIGARAVTAAVNGTGVDLANYESAAILLDVGTATGTTPSFTVVIQESDDNSSFSAVAAASLIGGALPTIDTTTDEQVYERGYMGQKRYLRVAVTAVSGTSPSVPLSALIVRGDAGQRPI